MAGEAGAVFQLGSHRETNCSSLSPLSVDTFIIIVVITVCFYHAKDEPKRLCPLTFLSL